MIKNRSPYYKTIPWVSPATGLTCTSYTLNIYVWNGLKTSPPAAPHYSITKNNITDSIESDKINIARLVSDFVDFNLGVPESSVLSNGNNQSWVRCEVFYTTSNASEKTLPQSITVDLMSNGYGYGMDGENPQPPTNKVLIPNATYKVYKTNGRFVVPIRLDEKPPLISASNDTFNILFQDTLMDVLDNDTLGYQPTSFVNVLYDWGDTDGTLTIENNQLKYNVGTVLNTPLTATYTIQDSTGETSTGDVTINISALPLTVTAVDDTYIVSNIGIQYLNVMANDVLGTEPTDIIAVDDTGLTSGSIGIAAGGLEVIYTPNGVIPSGNETFTYTIQDDTAATSVGTVTVKILVDNGGNDGVIMQNVGSGSGSTSCGQDMTITRYFEGLGTSPTLNDTIYINEEKTSPFIGGNSYYRISGGRSVKVDNSGVVTDLWICGAGSA